MREHPFSLISERTESGFFFVPVLHWMLNETAFYMYNSTKNKKRSSNWIKTCYLFCWNEKYLIESSKPRLIVSIYGTILWLDPYWKRSKLISRKVRMCSKLLIEANSKTRNKHSTELVENANANYNCYEILSPKLE